MTNGRRFRILAVVDDVLASAWAWFDLRRPGRRELDQISEWLREIQCDGAQLHRILPLLQQFNRACNVAPSIRREQITDTLRPFGPVTRHIGSLATVLADHGVGCDPDQ